MKQLFVAFLFALLAVSCSDKNDTPPLGPNTPGDTTVVISAPVTGRIQSKDPQNRIYIEGASVTVFDANTNQPVEQAFTDSLGWYSFVLDSGTYYVRVEAQDFYSSPRIYGAPIPFGISDSLPVERPTIQLKPDTTVVDAGILTGTVLSGGAGVSSILVTAMNQADSSVHSVSSGVGGAYTFFNLPAGTYTLHYYHAGYVPTSADSVVATVIADTIAVAPSFGLTVFSGTRLTGQITFLATQNGSVDMTLVNPVTRMAIPGLWTMNDSGLRYSLSDMPPGTYIAWGSYRNDGYVMDPDWIRKSGLPLVTFAPGDSARQLDFSVTGAITITAPTNPPESVLPVAISTTTPTFSWIKYPSTKEYIIAVYTSDGERIWGGWDANDSILHPQIPFSDTSAVFNFDGSATGRIIPGQIYQWKVYADNDNALGVQGLISSSEDQMGLFYYPDNE